MRANRAKASLASESSRSAEHDREAHIARRWQGPQLEAMKPQQSMIRQEPLPRSEVRQAPKRSGHKGGSPPTLTAVSQNGLHLPARTVPNAYEPFCHDYGSASVCRQNENAARTQRRRGDNHAPDDEHAPTPRTTRTTSSQGSSGWKVGGTCTFPGKTTFLAETQRLTRIRHVNQHVGCISHKFFTIRQSFLTASSSGGVIQQELQVSDREII